MRFRFQMTTEGAISDHPGCRCGKVAGLRQSLSGARCLLAGLHLRKCFRPFFRTPVTKPLSMRGSSVSEFGPRGIDPDARPQENHHCVLVLLGVSPRPGTG